MSRQLTQLLTPDLPAGASPQFGNCNQSGGSISGGHLNSMASLKSLLQHPMKGDRASLKDCCDVKGEKITLISFDCYIVIMLLPLKVLQCNNVADGVCSTYENRHCMPMLFFCYLAYFVTDIHWNRIYQSPLSTWLNWVQYSEDSCAHQHNLISGPAIVTRTWHDTCTTVWLVVWKQNRDGILVWFFSTELSSE